jgi:hypothetical protein
MAEALSTAGGLLLVVATILAGRRWLRNTLEQIAGETEVEGQPFSEADYSLNLAASQSWEIRNAIRRAVTLVQKGLTAEAITLLEKVKEVVPDQRVRTALDREIARLRGPAPVTPVPELRPTAPPGLSGDPGGDADEWPYGATGHRHQEDRWAHH